MDKETLSNYGWIVICVLVLAVMIALATPFGSFVAGAVENTTEGLFGASQKAMSIAGLEVPNQTMGDVPTVNGATNGGGEATPDTPALDKSVLANNSWAEIQEAVAAGKVAEMGWEVGDTLAVSYNGQEYEVMLIGVDHNEDNTATFMFTKPVMNSNVAHDEPSNTPPFGNGYTSSDLYTTKLPTIYNGLSQELKDCIIAERGTNLFIPSIVEFGLPAFDMDSANNGHVFDYFATDAANKLIDLAPYGSALIWARDYDRSSNYAYGIRDGARCSETANTSGAIFPAFVIG